MAGFFEKQEIIDLINLLLVLRIILRRDLELIGILRSPYFALSDETITEICLVREDNSLWSVLNDGNATLDLPSEQQDLLQRASYKLKKLQANVQTLPLPDLLIRILTSFKLHPC